MTKIASLFEELCKKYNLGPVPVIDMKIVHPRKLINLAQKSEKKKEKIQELMLKIQKKLNFDKASTSHLNIRDFQTKIMVAFAFAEAAAKKRLKSQFEDLQHIKSRSKSLNVIRSQIHQLSTKSQRITSLFVTFDTIKHKELFRDILKKRSRFSCILCQKKQKEKPDDKNNHQDRGRVEVGRVYAVEPPQPINILWKNYSYSFRRKLLRRTLSWSVYILLYLLRKILANFADFLALITVNYFSFLKSQVNLKRPICPPRIGEGLSEVVYDWSRLSGYSRNQIECLCFSRHDVLTAE